MTPLCLLFIVLYYLQHLVNAIVSNNCNKVLFASSTVGMRLKSVREVDEFSQKIASQNLKEERRSVINWQHKDGFHLFQNWVAVYHEISHKINANIPSFCPTFVLHFKTPKNDIDHGIKLRFLSGYLSFEKNCFCLQCWRVECVYIQVCIINKAKLYGYETEMIEVSDL